MALRSYFTLMPGVVPPGHFKPSAQPMLALQDLWERSRVCPPSLLFRVRSESDAGADVTSSDRLESCVGMVDSATRWRVVFRLLSDALASIQHPELKQAVGAALQFSMGRHPAMTGSGPRDEILSAVQALLRADGDGAPHVFEKILANRAAQLLLCDNDVEAAHVVPIVEAFCPFNPEEQRIEYQGRMATLETLSGAALLVEAQRRLSERMPVWHVAGMPALGPASEED